MDNKDIKILEAILFASGEPVDENDLKEKIKDFYTNRGINLIKTATNGLLELLKISVMN